MRALPGVIPSHLRQRVTTLAVLEQQLNICLPAECRPHCRVAGVDGDTLVLIADSPAWRSRIHFAASQIIGHFNQLDKFSLTRLRIRVGRPEPEAPPRRSRTPGDEPSAGVARAFEQLADDVDDEQLAASLRRLAARGKPSAEG